MTEIETEQVNIYDVTGHGADGQWYIAVIAEDAVDALRVAIAKHAYYADRPLTVMWRHAVKEIKP